MYVPPVFTIEKDNFVYYDSNIILLKKIYIEMGWI